MKEKTGDLQSRREFFKSIAKAVLPVMGAILVSHFPISASAVSTSCQYGCAGTCDTNCFGTCDGGCYNSCYGGCKMGCEGCKGGCTGTCNGACTGSSYF